MKNAIQIGLLAVIAGALVYLAVNKTGSTDAADAATTTAAASTTPATLAADPNAPATDPMKQAEQAVIDNRPKTQVVFGKYEHDFGKVKQNSENKHVFSFTNTGKEPLIIESATGSCGCTVPDYPKAPIPPGGKGEIKVEYKPGTQQNQQEKQVTVMANTDPKQTILRIKAFVEVDPNAPQATPVAAPGH